MRRKPVTLTAMVAVPCSDRETRHQGPDTEDEAEGGLDDAALVVDLRVGRANRGANFGSSAYSADSICSSMRCSCSESGTAPPNDSPAKGNPMQDGNVNGDMPKDER